MPAKSKAQQQMFGIAHAIQQGKRPAGSASSPATDVAKSAKPKDVKDFASTPTKGLPKKVKKEDVRRIREYVIKVVREVLAESNGNAFSRELDKADNDAPRDNIPALRKLLAQATKDSKNKKLPKRDHQMADAKRHLYTGILKLAKQGFYKKSHPRFSKEGAGLKEAGRGITTKMWKDAGEPFEVWLRYSQASSSQKAAVEKLFAKKYPQIKEANWQHDVKTINTGHRGGPPGDRRWEISWVVKGKANYEIVKSERAAKVGVDKKIRQLQRQGIKDPNVNYSKIN